MEQLVFRDVDTLRARVGEELGVSAWYAVTQEAVDAFAQLTGDHQWIHVDRERAAASPFGTTIAHGLLTLSIGPRFLTELVTIDLGGFGLNYGYDRVRFPAPLRVGARVRMRLTLSAVTDVPGGIQVAFLETFEVEGEAKPVCVAEVLARYVAAAP